MDGGAFSAGNSFNEPLTGNSAILRAAEEALGGASTNQVAGAIIVKGYAFTNADATSYYKAGTSPVSSLTYARTNKACFDVGNDPVTGMQVRCFQADEVPFAWHDSLEGVYNERLGFGLPVHDAYANIIDDSFPKSGWIVVGADTITANNAVAPDGTYTCGSTRRD